MALAHPRKTHYPEALEGHTPLQVLRTLAGIGGHEVYVVGGFVRDFLLGAAGTDIDVVVVGPGTALARAFADAVGSREVAVYENFGTALVKTGGYHVEFVGARKESYRANSRKPIVEDGTLYDDQLRRDLTINALSLALHPDRWGELVDPFDGLGDLERGIIRTPRDPDLTFSDDPLRMLRAVRFATRLGFTLPQELLAAIRRNRERIAIVSIERVTEEFNKLLAAAQPGQGFIHLFDTGLLELTFPEFVALHGVERVGRRAHKDNFYHTLQVVDNLCRLSDDLWLRWAAMLHDIAKPETKRFDPKVGWTFHGHEELGARRVPRIFQRLKLPQNEKMRYVQKLVRLHLRPIALVDEGVSDSAIRRLIVDAGEDLEDLMKLCRADITTRNPAKMERYLANFDAVEARIAEVTERDNLRNWQPPVTGELIMATFGLKPGKAVGEIKNAVREAILEGDIPNDYDAAVAYMHTVAQRVLAEEA